MLPAQGPRMRPGGRQKCRSHEQDCEHYRRSASGKCDSRGHRTHLQSDTEAEAALILLLWAFLEFLWVFLEFLLPPAQGTRARPGSGRPELQGRVATLRKAPRALRPES